MSDAADVARLAMRTVPGAMRCVRAGLDSADRGAMSPQRLALLRMLSRRDWTVGEMAEQQGVSAPTMSTAIAALDREGLVTRKTDPFDRRRVIVAITDEGGRRLDALARSAEAELAAALKDLSQVDLDALAAGLEVLGKLGNGGGRSEPV